jgi:hypothetical protein
VEGGVKRDAALVPLVQPKRCPPSASRARIIYNLGNFLRTLATPEAVAEWSLASLREIWRGEVAEWLNAAVLKCVQLTSTSLRKFYLSTINRLTRTYPTLS